MVSVTATLEKEDCRMVAFDYGRVTGHLSEFTGLNLTWFTGAAGRNTEIPVSQACAPPPRSWEEDFLGQDVSRFFYRWGGTFSAVLTKLRGRYDGDLDQFLLHLVFMLTELAAVNAVAEARSKGAERTILRRRGLNVLSLADITRIPRESVRRKLAALEARELVAREGDGLYYLGQAADLDRFFYDLAPLFWDKARPA